jgi:hypothetical protein
MTTPASLKTLVAPPEVRAKMPSMPASMSPELLMAMPALLLGPVALPLVAAKCRRGR